MKKVWEISILFMLNELAYRVQQPFLPPISGACRVGGSYVMQKTCPKLTVPNKIMLCVRVRVLQKKWTNKLFRRQKSTFANVFTKRSLREKFPNFLLFSSPTSSRLRPVHMYRPRSFVY